MSVQFEMVQRTVFGVVNVMHLNQTDVAKMINKDMAHEFNNFFYQKVTNITSNILFC